MVAGKVGGHLQRLSHLEREEDEVGVEVWRQLLAPRNVLFAKRDGRLALARIQWGSVGATPASGGGSAGSPFIDGTTHGPF